MYRYSTKGDFRSNITLGGQMERYQPSKEQIDMAIKACKVVGVDFAEWTFCLERQMLR